jgi:hypothetical protein
MKRFLEVAVTVLVVGGLSMTPSRAQGKDRSMTGTVVDTYCLVTMGMGGKAHKQCAMMCARNGAPLSIKEEKTGALYLIAGQKNMVYASAGLEQYVEEKVTVKGKVYERDGVKMIVVDAVAPAR